MKVIPIVTFSMILVLLIYLGNVKLLIMKEHQLTTANLDFLNPNDEIIVSGLKSES